LGTLEIHSVSRFGAKILFREPVLGQGEKNEDFIILGAYYY